MAYNTGLCPTGTSAGTCRLDHIRGLWRRRDPDPGSGRGNEGRRIAQNLGRQNGSSPYHNQGLDTDADTLQNEPKDKADNSVGKTA